MARRRGKKRNSVEQKIKGYIWEYVTNLKAYIIELEISLSKPSENFHADPHK